MTALGIRRKKDETQIYRRKKRNALVDHQRGEIWRRFTSKSWFFEKVNIIDNAWID